MTEAIYIYKKRINQSPLREIPTRHRRRNLEHTYNSFRPLSPEVPHPTAAGVKTLLDDIAGKNPKAAEANPKEFVDGSFVDEMERSGFIKKLYGK